MNQDTCMKVAVYAVIAIVVILVVRHFLNQENFANEHKHKHIHKTHHKVRHEEKHGHDLHKTPGPVHTHGNGPAQELIPVNNREIIFNSQGNASSVTAYGNKDWTPLAFAYGPFGYAATSEPVPSGMKLAFRVYAVYSDNMQPSFQMNPHFQSPASTAIEFRFGWNQDQGDFTIELPLTWGDPAHQRDAYSELFTLDDIKKSGVQDPTMHAGIWALPTSESGVTTIYKLAIQSYYVKA